MLVSTYTLLTSLYLLVGIHAGFHDNNQYGVANTSNSGLESEGDMFYNEDHSDPNVLNRVKRMITDHESAKWPKGIVPYIFVDKSSIVEYKRIMALFEDNLCLRFVYWNKNISQQLGLGHPGHLKFKKGSGCVTVLGLYRRSSGQNIYCCGGMYSSGGPSLTVLFPELKMTLDYYYMFMEIAWAYKCNELEPCNNRNLTCVNDGFQSSVHGKCTCKCPNGLDPDTGCATPLTKVSSTWPRGKYALPKPKTGCPNNNFKDGEIIHYGEVKNVISSPYHLMGDIKGKKAEQHYCTRTLDDDHFNAEEEKFNWPVGNYCIYRKGGTCPVGFYPGHVQYDDVKPTNGQRNSNSGELPDGIYGEDTRIEFCCQYKGFTKDPAIFPTEKPFALLRLGKSCQQVEGMHVREEWFGFDNPKNGKFEVSGLLAHYTNKRLSLLYLYVCYYSPADMNCGAGVVLDKATPEITIEADSTGHVDMDCTWVVRGEHEEGTLVLDFEEFDVKRKSGKCVDNVEVRHARIGAAGLHYCGEKIRHSIRTITNKILVRFSAVGVSNSSFKAKIKWVPNKDLCYDAEARGVSYNGLINYTRVFKPCLPWSQSTVCQHHPFQQGDQLEHLEGNYCRNPDNSFRPWCYTDLVGCKRNYCDVCKLEKPYDQIDYCDKLKDKGFCTRYSAKAVEYCARTCHDALPSTGQIQKYSEIACDPPTTPADGEIVGEKQLNYSLGDVVDFKCKRGPSVVSTRCMTSGQWSPVGYSCLVCPHNYAVYNELCYGLIKEGKTFKKEDAKKECEKIGGFIGVPRNSEESDVIDSVRRNRDIWLAVNDIKTEGKWVYDNGADDIIWSHWRDGQPNNHRDREDCAGMRPGQEWTDDPCSSLKLSVVCAINKTDNIEGKDLLGSYCTDLLRSRPTMCQDHPSYASKYCAKTCGIHQGHSTSCPVQPSNPNVLVSTASATIQVGDTVTFSCANFRYKIQGSEIRACQYNGLLNGHDLKCGECPVGYTLFNNTCYGFIDARVFTFMEAREECRNVDGFVASPKDISENDMISSLGFGQPLWIGATDIVNEDQFVLEDGSHMLWKNWANGKPKRNTRIDCIMMAENKKWTYIGCSSVKLGTVCSIPRQGSDMCYSQYDKGVTYNGKAYYTNTFQYCLHWTEVTNCPHHAFNKGDARHNLEENYCRNPDNSLRPWCYTDAYKCTKSYCNVCDTALPVDKANDCDVQKRQGLCKTNRARAIIECATTCNDELPSVGSVKNYIKIECTQPHVPADGEIVSISKSKYHFGDVVTLKCKSNMFMVNTTCLTSGEWSSVGLVCTECPLGYVLFKGSCYSFKDKSLTYPQAQKECGQIGGHLPMPKTREENDFVHSLQNGKYIWLGANDTRKEGTYYWNDGTKIEWNNWTEMKPNVKYNCLSMKPTKLWDDNLCDFTWSKMGLMCSVPKFESGICEDFLQKQCLTLLMRRPTMCKEFTEYSATFCANTCGVCGANDIRCPVQPTDPNAIVSVSSSTIPVGNYVKFKCNDEYHAFKGDIVQACQANGQLTGMPVQCKLISQNIVKVGSITLTRGEKSIPERNAFTGENDQLRIKNDGQIVAWEFYSHSPMQTSFQVWRKIENNRYRLVGQNILTTGNNTRQRYDVAKDDQINVKWGDLIGIWNAGKGGVHFDECDSKLHPNWYWVSWSKKRSSASAFHVGALETFESDVGCCQFFFRAEVFVTVPNTHTCEDFLDRQCPALLDSDPTICTSSPESSLKSCEKTCGFCGAHEISCPVQPDDSRVSVSTTRPSIPVGAYVQYKCKSDNYIAFLGNSTRACQSNGQLTGTALACRRKLTIGKAIVGSPTLTRGQKVIPELVAFTGENDLLRIKNDGHIVAWEFYSHSLIKTGFQVWRKIKTNQYLLVGQNILTPVKENAQQRYEVPTDEQIKVKKGDLLGIWNSVTGGIHFNECDSKVHPEWAWISWSSKRTSASDFKVGTAEKFNSDPACCQFFFNAEIAITE